MPLTRLEIQEGIARLTLDDGKVNAMSRAMLGEISAQLETTRAEARVTVIRGREGIFSAGFDLKTMGAGPAQAIAMVRDGARLVEQLLAHPHPVLTACTGHAYPMGAFVMLAADSRLGIDGPYRIGMNETAIGLTVPKFALALAEARLTGHGYARVAAASLFSPNEAREMGYLDYVVAREELDARVETEAERLASLDPESFSQTKARVNAPILSAIARAIEEELAEAA